MSAATAALVRKEAHALLPVWMAAAIAMAADPLLAGTGLRALFPLGTFAYILGSLMLGAHVVGHEYSLRTLGSLLTLPCRRSTILQVKAGVLAIMLLALSLLAWPLLYVLVPAGGTHPLLPLHPMMPLAIAGGLLVAPWMTMRLRSQMAGVVFTAAIPGTAYVAFLLVGVLKFGVSGNAAETFATTVLTPTVVVFAAVAGLLGVRAFLQWQDTEGGRDDLRLPRWMATIDRQPLRPPLWMLVKKELRLQQLTFAMPVVFGGVWGALTVAARLNPAFTPELLRGIGLLYFALLPLLIGSLASAQERQFGTLQSQAMLPVPFAQQWAVKAGVVLLLAVALGVLLPLAVFGPARSRDVIGPMTVVILLLAAWSLYLSSWAPSGIIALALVLPATAAGLVAGNWIDGLVRSFGPAHTFVPRATAAMTSLAVAGPLVVALVLLAGRNHRRVERNVMHMAAQAACLLGLFAAADLVFTAVL